MPTRGFCLGTKGWVAYPLSPKSDTCLLPGSIPVLGQYGHSERAFGCDTHETAALVCRGEGHFVAVQAVSSILSQTKDIFEMQSEFSDLGQFFFHHEAKALGFFAS